MHAPTLVLTLISLSPFDRLPSFLIRRSIFYQHLLTISHPLHPQTNPLPSQLQAQLDTLTYDVEQKLRLQSSIRQSFEMTMDGRFASLKEEIKKQLVQEMKVS